MGYATCGVTAEGLESLSNDSHVFLQLLVQFQLCLISGSPLVLWAEGYGSTFNNCTNVLFLLITSQM